jgi:hypothetical protein
LFKKCFGILSGLWPQISSLSFLSILLLLFSLFQGAGVVRAKRVYECGLVVPGHFATRNAHWESAVEGGEKNQVVKRQKDEAERDRETGREGNENLLLVNAICCSIRTVYTLAPLLPAG